MEREAQVRGRARPASWPWGPGPREKRSVGHGDEEERGSEE